MRLLISIKQHIYTRLFLYFNMGYTFRADLGEDQRYRIRQLKAIIRVESNEEFLIKLIELFEQVLENESKQTEI